jgi:hypothetical protein
MTIGNAQTMNRVGGGGIYNDGGTLKMHDWTCSGNFSS